MSSIGQRLLTIKSNLPNEVTLVAVSKTKTKDDILQAYETGHRVFGENKVQELAEKAVALPSDIKWHMIGHLQSNKVKYIAPFISLIHAVDSQKLLLEISKRAQQHNKNIRCLLQLRIAQEDTKFGLSKENLTSLLSHHYPNVDIVGLMGMASNTNDEEKVKSEFRFLKSVFDELTLKYPKLSILSMGMSGDYDIAIEEGSNMIRIGSSIFGKRTT